MGSKAIAMIYIMWTSSPNRTLLQTRVTLILNSSYIPIQSIAQHLVQTFLPDTQYKKYFVNKKYSATG